MNNQNHTFPSWILRGCEWIFTLLGAAICIGVAIVFASQQYNDLWPTPGFYFIELLLLALVVLLSRVLDLKSVRMDYSLITWVAGGILLAFVILAGFSMGPYLFPAMLAFWLSAIASDLRQGPAFLQHIALGFTAALFQGCLIGLFLLLTSAVRS